MSADIAAIRARIAAASPGPWSILSAGSAGNDWFEIDAQPHEDDSDDDDSDFVRPLVVATLEAGGGSDADLIAHAPTDLAALCDEVEQLKTKLENLTNAVSGAWAEIDEADGTLIHALSEGHR